MEGHGLRRCHHHPSSSPDQPQKRYKKFTAVIHKDADHARSCSCPHPQRFRQICDFFSPAQHHLSCFNVMVVWVSNRSKIKTKETKDPPPSSSTTTPTSWSALQRLHCPRFAHIRGGGGGEGGGGRVGVGLRPCRTDPKKRALYSLPRCIDRCSAQPKS